MRKSIITTHWFDPVFRMNYWLAVGLNLEEMKTYYKKTFGKHLERDDTPGACMLHVLYKNKNDGRDSDGLVIWLPQWSDGGPRDVSALCHECFHAMDFALKACSVMFDQKGAEWNEPHAYYLGYLVRTCMEAIEKRNKSVICKHQLISL